MQPILVLSLTLLASVASADAHPSAAIEVKDEATHTSDAALVTHEVVGSGGSGDRSGDSFSSSSSSSDDDVDRRGHHEHHGHGHRHMRPFHSPFATSKQDMEPFADRNGRDFPAFSSESSDSDSSDDEWEEIGCPILGVLAVGLTATAVTVFAQRRRRRRRQAAYASLGQNGGSDDAEDATLLRKQRAADSCSPDAA